jgi:uncharacterized membrane protein YdjX (TVP38/TMEM64 family)
VSRVSGESLPALCLLLFADGATFSFFTTPLLLEYGKHHPPWQVAVAGGASSALGNIVQLWLLRQALSDRWPWMRRLAPRRERLAETLSRYPSASFLALVVARATPMPDAPLKLVAAATGYPYRRYFLAILLGALPYYFALALVGNVVQIPTPWLIAVGAGLAIALIVDLWRRRGRDRS